MLMRFCFAAAAVCALTVALPAAQPHSSPYVGHALCQRCHIDFAKLWESLPHSQKMLARDDRPAGQRGCESCHGPAGDHTTTRRKSIVSWRKLTPPERNKICLQCHQDKLSAELWAKGPHNEKVSCENCHNVHRPTKRDKLLKPEEGKECSPCHDKLDDLIKAKRHHTLADGAVTCTQCHSFHGSKQRHLLAQPQGDMCKDCHSDNVPKAESHKRADWKLKHGPDAKGHEADCRMCHEPETFCQQCHVVKVPHAAGFAEAHKEASQQQPKACLKCHDEAFCKQCHDAVPPPVGPAPAKDAKK